MLKEKKIKSDPHDFPAGQVFLMSVDGVNFTIREPRAENPGSHWYDHKLHSAGISYEVTVDVRHDVADVYGLIDLGQVKSLVMVL